MFTLPPASEGTEEGGKWGGALLIGGLEKQGAWNKAQWADGKLPSVPGPSYLFAPVKESLQLGFHMKQFRNLLPQLLHFGQPGQRVHGVGLLPIHGSNLDPHGADNATGIQRERETRVSVAGQQASKWGTLTPVAFFTSD